MHTRRRDRTSHEQPMTPKELRARISRLPARGETAEALERTLRNGAPRSTWYATQKEHLLGWLGEYDGPGYYDRSNWNRSAQFAYNHFQCAPGLVWIAEAAGAPREILLAAKRAVLAAPRNGAAQCGAVRRILPWVWVEALLKRR